MRLLAPSQPPGADAIPAVGELETMSDADLLDAWNRDRHRSALAVLVKRYSRMVLGVCRRRCRTDSDADDAFQTTFLYLAHNGHKIRHPERLVGWLHRVAQRAAVATLPSTERESSPMVEPPAPADDPLQRLAQRHEAIVLDEELAELPEHYRSAIVMHLCEGQSIQVLAERMQTTPGSIRGRLQRGKQLLAQRLRRRGVVPVMAYAAVQSLAAGEASACEASDLLLDKIIDDAPLPDPPIETSLLESLLAQGVRLMPSLYTISGLVGGTALIALLMMADGSGHAGEGQELSFAATQSQAESPGAISVTTPPLGQMGIGGAGMGGGDGTVAPNATPAPGSAGAPFPFPSSSWVQRTVTPQAESEIAEQARDSMDSNLDLDLAGNLSDVQQQLGEAIGVPVLLDQRGLQFANADPDSIVMKLSANALPLRTALRKLFEPHGLKAVVEEEGIVITADPSVLVHKGIGTTRWINIDEEAEAKIASGLDSSTTLELIDMPLSEVVAHLQDQHGIPMAIDSRALEEIGLSGEEPVTLTTSGVSLRSALKRILSNLDMTYTISGETLVLTTIEAAEQDLVTRVYWLEGTGFPNGDFQTITDAVQTAVIPDTWEALGGPSTMVPLNSSRPAIMISTVYTIHETLDSFFTAMRETHFGVEPVIENIEVPSRNIPGGFGGGMGGFGGGGMGGGFF